MNRAQLPPKEPGLKYLLAFLWLGLNAFAFEPPQSEEVATWIERMKANLDKAYYTKIEGFLQLTQGGQQVRIELKGRLTYKDPTHARLKMTMDTKINSNPATMDLLVVSDGTYVWQEIRSSLMEGAMVEKAEIGADEMASQWMDMADWTVQLKEIKELGQLEVVKQGGGQVILEGLLDEAGIAELGLSNQSAEIKSKMIYRVVLDEKTVFPLAILKGLPDKPALHLRFTDHRFLDKTVIPEGAFGYEPPADQITQMP